jgi:hypothetical protein
VTSRPALVLAALAALVAAGCGGNGGYRPVRETSPPDALGPTATASPHPSAAAAPTAVAPPDTRALHPQVRGQGPGLVGTVAVPARFAVSVTCSGAGRLVVQVDGRDVLPTECGPDTDSFVAVERRPAGRSRVRVSIDAAPHVRWAAVVVTAPA